MVVVEGGASLGFSAKDTFFLGLPQNETEDEATVVHVVVDVVVVDVAVVVVAEEAGERFGGDWGDAEADLRMLFETVATGEEGSTSPSKDSE